MGKQPGVMLYFDLRGSLNRLSLEDKGRLLDAILDFGQYGAVPEFEGMLGLAWDFIQPRVERDRERYEEKVQKCIDAANRRWTTPSDASEGSRMRTHADVCERMPTTSTTTTTKPKTNTPSTTNTKTTTGPGPVTRATATKRPELDKSRWRPVVPIEEEIANRNRLAREFLLGQKQGGNAPL